MQQHKLKRLKQNHLRGFSLVEMMVALGVTGIVAFGTGAVMLENFKNVKKFELKAGGISFVEEIRSEIYSATVRQKQYGAAATPNCDNRLRFKATDGPAIIQGMVNDYGAKLALSMSADGDVDQESATESLVRSTFGNRMRVLDLSFQNGYVVDSTEDMSLITGEVYLTVDNENSWGASEQKMRKIYVGTLALEINNFNGTINKCDMPSTSGNIPLYCSMREGYFYNIIENRCTYLGNETGTTLPTKGDCTIHDGKTVDCDNDIISGGAIKGDMSYDAAAPVGLVDSGVITTQMGQFDNHPAIDSCHSSCRALKRNHDDCIAAAQGIAEDIAKCPPAPSATTNCAVVTRVGATASLLPPTADLAPLTTDCKCGPLKITNGAYCGYCVFKLTQGYHFTEDEWRIYQCQNRNLTMVGQGTNPEAHAQAPAETTCDGEWHNANSTTVLAD